MADGIPDFPAEFPGKIGFRPRAPAASADYRVEAPFRISSLSVTREMRVIREPAPTSLPNTGGAADDETEVGYCRRTQKIPVS